MNDLTPLERAVLEKLLHGDHPLLATLRLQAERARLVSREYTGVGFFCNFDVPADAEPTSVSDFVLSDLRGDIDGLKYGAGFLLFVRGGRMTFLEGFTYAEDWPETIGAFTLRYLDEPRKLRL